MVHRWLEDATREILLCVTRSQLVTGVPIPSTLHLLYTSVAYSSSLQGDQKRITSVIDRWRKTTTCPCASRRWWPRASKPAPKTTTRHRYGRGRRRPSSRSRCTTAARSVARRSRRTKRSADTRRATASLQRRHTMAGRRHRRHRPSIVRRGPRKRRRRRPGAAPAPGGTSARCATGTSPPGRRSAGTRGSTTSTARRCRRRCRPALRARAGLTSTRRPLRKTTFHLPASDDGARMRRFRDPCLCKPRSIGRQMLRELTN